MKTVIKLELERDFLSLLKNIYQKKKKEKHNQYNAKKTECLPSKILNYSEISAFNSLIQNNTGVLTRRAEEIKAYRLERNKTVLFAVNKMIEIIYMTMWTAPRNL